MLYDLIIIGAGPAGITSAIYAARRKIKFLLLSLDIGGQMSWSSDVDNYPGLPDLPGIELTKRFQDHMADYNIKPKIGEVLDIKSKGKTLEVFTRKNKYETKAIIIASGKSPKKLEVPGEEELIGKGVSYCATCDAPLYKDKTVAIVGGGNSALDAALFLSKYAKKIYILDINPKLGGDPILKEKVLQSNKVTHVPKVKVTKIIGDEVVTSLEYEQDSQPKKIDVRGVFIEIGLVSRINFGKILKKNKWGEIMIFRSTETHEENKTNIPGIFAAGDVTDIPAKQIGVAVGEGIKASLAAFNYIDKLRV